MAERIQHTEESLTATLLDQYAYPDGDPDPRHHPDDNPIRNWLRYRLCAKPNVDADESERAHGLYQALWPDSRNGMATTGETMCSFWTTYKQALALAEPDQLGLTLSRAGKLSWSSFGLNNGAKRNGTLEAILRDFDRFPLHARHGELQRFARLTHSLANLIVVPQGLNGSRNAFLSPDGSRIPESERTYDYWDLTLHHLLSAHPPAYLERFAEPFRTLLQRHSIHGLALDPWFEEAAHGKDPAALTEQDVRLLPGHGPERPLPATIADLDALVEETNRRIEARASILAEPVGKRRR